MEHQLRERKPSSSLTRLMRACASGQQQVVHSLLTEGDDVNARGPRGSTALMFAASTGHLEVVKELVAFGANHELQEDGGWDAARHADEDGHEDVSTFLKLVSRHRTAAKS